MYWKRIRLLVLGIALVVVMFGNVAAVGTSGADGSALESNGVTNSGGGSSGANHSPAAPQAPADTPFPLVSGVNDYTLTPPKLYLHVKPTCNPALAAGPATNTTTESISRVAVQGSAPRTLYSNVVGPTCPQQTLSIQSNVVADANYVYWTSACSVMRLSTFGSVRDAPGLLGGHGGRVGGSRQ